MISLFIDTSSSDVSIAIIKDNNILSYITKEVPNEHSVYTVKYISDILIKASLTPKDIDKIMVVNGPGSFTGVRIGVTIAKTYAYLLNKELILLSSLKILSISTNHDYCLSLISAKNDNYYIGLYNKDNNIVIEEQFANIDKVLQIINKYNPKIVSDNNIEINNNKITKQKLDFIKIINYYKNAKSINPHLAVPNYLKLPQALENN